MGIVPYHKSLALNVQSKTEYSINRFFISINPQTKIPAQAGINLFIFGFAAFVVKNSAA